AHRRIEQSRRQAAMHRANRVVVVLSRLHLEDRTALFHTAQPKADKRRDRWRGESSAEYAPQVLEAAEGATRSKRRLRILPRHKPLAPWFIRVPPPSLPATPTTPSTRYHPPFIADRRPAERQFEPCSATVSSCGRLRLAAAAPSSCAVSA